MKNDQTPHWIASWSLACLAFVASVFLVINVNDRIETQRQVHEIQRQTQEALSRLKQTTNSPPPKRKNGV